MISSTFKTVQLLFCSVDGHGCVVGTVEVGVAPVSRQFEAYDVANFRTVGVCP